MRLWMVDPKYMCRQHLLGEHYECHSMVGALNNGKTLSSFTDNGLIEIHNIGARHEELAKEMLRRGYKHESPLKKYPHRTDGKIDIDANVKELMRRCPECHELMMRKARGWCDICEEEKPIVKGFKGNCRTVFICPDCEKDGDGENDG